MSLLSSVVSLWFWQQPLPPATIGGYWYSFAKFENVSDCRIASLAFARTARWFHPEMVCSGSPPERSAP